MRDRETDRQTEIPKVLTEQLPTQPVVFLRDRHRETNKEI